VAVLQSGSPGRVLTVFCDDVHLSRQHLRLASEELSPAPTVVGLEWEEAPALAREIDEIRDALADAARALWPSWYTTVDQRFDDRHACNPDFERLVRDLAQTAPQVSASWLRVAWQRCRDAQLPIVSHLAAAQQVRQLARALDPNRLVCILSVASDSAPIARIRGLARAAEWLAHEALAQVHLLVPNTWQTHSELDHVTYGALTYEAYDAEAPDSVCAPVELKDPAPAKGRRVALEAPTALPPIDAPFVSVGPICGRPHPKSYVEQTVHRHIQADALLSKLFEYNQRLITHDNKAYTVDLVWREGRLVVELDGAEHHNQHNYVKDRDRDYRLQLCGYIVLRITNTEVYVDPELAMVKIRSMVALRQEPAAPARD
jgi:very-short-patch-repair endonuclease